MRKIHLDLKELKRLIEVEELQQWKVADIFGVSRDTVCRNCKEYGIKTQRTGPKRGKLHPEWKGGVRYVKGYRYIYSPKHPNRTKSRYVSEHRLVMEEKIGRYLTKNEVVHHIDGDSLNNKPDNLVLFGSNADHLKHELTGKCPGWTPDGIRRIKTGILKASLSNAKNPEMIKLCEDRLNQEFDRQT